MDKYINPIDPMGNSMKWMKLPFTALKVNSVPPWKFPRPQTESIVVFQAKNGLGGELLNDPRIFWYLKGFWTFRLFWRVDFSLTLSRIHKAYVGEHSSILGTNDMFGD